MSHLHILNRQRRNQEKKFRCDYCDKEFDEHNMKNHYEKAHMNLKPFGCEVCKKCFATPRFIEKHVSVVHEGIKDYWCDICDERFSSKSNLEGHFDRNHK